MTIPKTHFRIFLIAISLFTLANNSSFAGGFPVRPKRLLLSPSVSYFYANSGWDSLRRKNPFPDNGRFTSLGFSLYAEYGISRRLTAVALLPYVRNTYEDNKGSTLNTGLTDLELGLRYYVANINYIYYFTVQGTYITPLYKNLALGYAEQGAELKLAFAGSGKVFGKNYYFTLENGVRQYFGPDGPTQDRYTGTFGLTLDRRFHHQLSVSLGGFYSSSKFTQFSPIQAINKNFAFNQASLTYGYTANKRLSFFATGGHFINGRNTGNGTTASFSVLIKPFR
jgi:protein XagA